jgi:hypothetical protein
MRSKWRNSPLTRRPRNHERGETELLIPKDFKAACLRPIEGFVYRGKKDLFGTWGLLPFSVNRDSAVLERSAWRVVVSDLMQCFRSECDGDRAPTPTDSFEVLSSDHWACGWVNQLMVDTTNDQAMRSAYIWYRRWKENPILDEDDYTELERKEHLEILRDIYSLTELEAEWALSGMHHEGREFSGTSDEEVDRFVNEYAYPEPDPTEHNKRLMNVVHPSSFDDDHPPADYAAVVVSETYVRVRFSDDRTAGFPTKQGWAGPALCFAKLWAKDVEVIEGEKE